MKEMITNKRLIVIKYFFVTIIMFNTSLGLSQLDQSEKFKCHVDSTFNVDSIYRSNGGVVLNYKHATITDQYGEPFYVGMDEYSKDSILIESVRIDIEKGVTTGYLFYLDGTLNQISVWNKEEYGIVTTFFPNGNLASIIHYNENGNEHGWIYIYDENGFILEKKYYSDGVYLPEAE